MRSRSAGSSAGSSGSRRCILRRGSRLHGALLFAVVFGRLGVQHHDNFGTWSYDMGIYDQGFWLVSRGGQSFMTVRGMDFWGHHLNLIVLAFVPFYWLGAGPSFLYVAQASVLGLGSVPDLPDRPRPLPPSRGWVCCSPSCT